MEQIVNKTDFYIDVELQDADGVVINPNTIEFNIYHFTNTTKHISSKIADELTNCIVLGGIIRCYIDGFDFEFTGQLKEQVEIIYAGTFPDGKETIINSITNLEAIII